MTLDPKDHDLTEEEEIQYGWYLQSSVLRMHSLRKRMDFVIICTIACTWLIRINKRATCILIVVLCCWIIHIF